MIKYYDEPVAKKHADVFYQVSTLDIGAITEVAKKEKVDLKHILECKRKMFMLYHLL